MQVSRQVSALGTLRFVIDLHFSLEEVIMEQLSAVGGMN